MMTPLYRLPGIDIIDTGLCAQFVLILVMFVCMGAGCGFERSLLPRMASKTFHMVKSSTRLNFVATFGLSKAIANAVSGALADTLGRKPVVVIGFLIGLPVMPYVIFAQSWTGITIMNCCFGLSQGLIGSALFFLMIDLMGPKQRGIAVGIGESTIYISTALINILAGRLAHSYGMRPIPFIWATGFSVLGFLTSLFIQDTLDQVQAEQQLQQQEDQNINNHKPLFSSPMSATSQTPRTTSLSLTPTTTPRDDKQRKKYSKMMSTQPSYLDEDIVEEFLNTNPQYSAYCGGDTNDGSSAAGNKNNVGGGYGGLLNRVPSYQTFEGGLTPHWAHTQQQNQNNDKDNEGSTVAWDISHETPPICIPKPAPPKPKTNNILIIENYDLVTAQQEAKATEMKGYNRRSREGNLGGGAGFGSRIGGGGGGGSRLTASRYSTIHSDAETFVKETGSVMVSVLLKSRSSETGSSSSWRVLKSLLSENRSYVALCFAGMALNFKDGFAWGSFPVFFQHELGLSPSDTDTLIALYPLTWGFFQAIAGALSDKFGRKFFLVGGMAACSIAMASYALPRQLWINEETEEEHSRYNNRFLFWYFILSDVVLGLGTAMVYPALQAAAADEVDPMNRGLALGFYRFVRDMGYVVGAVLCGHLTDWIGYEHTFWVNSAVLAIAMSLLAGYYQPKTQVETALAVMLAEEMMMEDKMEEEDEEEEDEEGTSLVSA